MSESLTLIPKGSVVGDVVKVKCYVTSVEFEVTK